MKRIIKSFKRHMTKTVAYHAPTHGMSLGAVLLIDDCKRKNEQKKLRNVSKITLSTVAIMQQNAMMAKNSITIEQEHAIGTLLKSKVASKKKKMQIET